MAQSVISKAWYHEFWVWYLIAFPIAAVVGGFITLAFALHTQDGLVGSDYYRVGLTINRQIAREQKASMLDLRATASVNDGLIRIHMTSKEPLPAALSLKLIHPTRMGMDQTIQLKITPDGSYEGQLKAMQPAHWQVVLEDVGRHWRLEGKWNTILKGEIHFSS